MSDHREGPIQMAMRAMDRGATEPTKQDAHMLHQKQARERDTMKGVTMRVSDRRLAFLCLVAVTLLGCEQSDRDPEGAIAPAGTVAAIVWDLAAVESKLRSAGLQPVRSADSVRQPFMTVAGSLLNFGIGEIQVYIYADASAREHDTHRLDPHHVAPPHMMVSWRMPPTLIVSDNLAAILLTHDAALRAHVRRALTHASHGGS